MPLAIICCALTLGLNNTESSLGAEPHNQTPPNALRLDLASSKPPFLSDGPCWLTAWTQPKRERFLLPANQSPQGRVVSAEFEHLESTMKIQKGATYSAWKS